MALPSSTSSSWGSHQVSPFSPQMQGRICSDEHIGSWQSYPLEIIKCWSFFFFFPYFPAIWFLLMGDLQRHRPAPEECLRLLQMARSLRISKPAEQTGCGTPKSSQHLHILSHTDLNTNPCSSEMPSAPQEQLKPNHMQLSVWSLHKQVLRLCWDPMCSADSLLLRMNRTRSC